MTDHYNVLGVPRDASQELIYAAYRALVKAFHPDVFQIDKAFAEERLKAINAAFGALIDSAKRQQESEKTSRGDKGSTPEDAKNWKRVCEFFPTLVEMEKEIVSVNVELGSKFRFTILEKKAFKEAALIRDSLMMQFAQKRFGQDLSLQKAGIASLQLGFRRFALAINQACELVGDSDPITILKRLAMDYPDDAIRIYSKCGLQSLLPAEENSLTPGLYRIKGKLSFRMLPDKTVVVFSEANQQLTEFRKFADIKALLLTYGETESSIHRLENS